MIKEQGTRVTKKGQVTQQKEIWWPGKGQAGPAALPALLGRWKGLAQGKVGGGHELGISKGPWCLAGRCFSKAEAPVDAAGTHEPPPFLRVPAPASHYRGPASSCLSYKGSEEGVGNSPQTRPSQGRMPMAPTCSFFRS